MRLSIVYRGGPCGGNPRAALASIAAALAACTAPAPSAGPAEARPSALPRGGLSHTAHRALGARGPLEPLELAADSETDRALRSALGHRAPVAPRARRNVWDRPSGPASLTRPITGGRLVMQGGEALTAALEALPAERRALGVAALPFADLFGPNGTGGLCESLAVDVDLEGGFEARYRVEPLLLYAPPEPMLYALSSTCTAALARAGANVAGAVGAGCTREDEAAHFAAGSTCRACLAVDGDHGRCLNSGACPAQTARTLMVSEGGRVVFYDVERALTLGCAPDRTGELVLLVHDRGPGDPIPEPFDHAAVGRVCGYYWSNAAGEPRIACTAPAAPIAPAIADVVIMRLDYLRRAGDARTPLAQRTVIADALEAGGVRYEGMTLFPGRLAEISVADQRIGGYGFAPGALRPDGTDPTNIDHTYAREWIGTVAMKTSTTLDGVPIDIYDRNLCATPDWRGPDARGRYYCKGPFVSVDAPPVDDLRWRYDYGAYYVGLQPERIEIFPTATLAATGRMDPNIPGGHVPEVLGSPVLADPEWENCAWPRQFEPDEMAVADTGTPGTYTFTTQTYRFGKDPRVDVRVILVTSWRRGFCFEPLE